MAPNVTLHFFAPNDLNGDPIAEITDESPYFKGLRLQMDRDGLGGAELLLQRGIDLTAIESAAFGAEVFVRMLVHAYSDTEYYPWGFFFSKRQLTVIHVDEDGGEEFLLGGPGPKHYLSRGILGIGTPTTGWNLDLANGDWRWTDNATIGNILTRIINQDANEDDPALPDLTRSFTADIDSAGVDWADTDVSGAANQYRIPIGTSVLQAIWDLDDIVELTSWISLGSVGAPEFLLNVIQGLGEDYTGSAFGASVCLLREGDNIANDSLEVEGASLKKASHVVVEGANGVWAEAERTSFDPGDYVKRVKIEYTRTDSLFWLEKAGLRWLRKQDLGEKEIRVEILPGADDTAGLYFPAPDRVLWLSNLISLDTSADGTTEGDLDYSPADDQLVTGFQMDLGPAGDTTDATAKARSWKVVVKLNVQRNPIIEKTPNQGSAGAPGPKGDPGSGLLLCRTGQPGTDPVEEETTVLKDYMTDPVLGGSSILWDGIIATEQDPSNPPGSTIHFFKSAAPDLYQESWACGPGHVRVSGYIGCTSDGFLKIAFFSSTPPEDPPNSAALLQTNTLTPAQPGHEHAPEWTPFSADVTAPAGTVSAALTRSVAVDFNCIIVAVDVEAQPGVPGDAGDCPEDLGLECDVGTGTRAARCDHVHAHGNLSDGGTHHHDITQIEDGTTGTDDHVADTADAHDASAISVLDTGGNFTATDVEAALAEIQDRIDALPTGGIGEILISDTPSTPLIFADLIQNEAQDDLVYADP